VKNREEKGYANASKSAKGTVIEDDKRRGEGISCKKFVSRRGRSEGARKEMRTWKKAIRAL